jgi:phenylalanyl-tRNA synthetase beta chain
MRAFNLPSEASVRFSKGIHPETVKPAAERAAALMAQHAGGSVCRGLVDTYPAPLAPQIVTLSLAEVRRQLGIGMTDDEAARILTALEFHVEQVDAHTLRATVPPHRLDVQAGSADLIEELIRIHGYDRLPATLLADRLPQQHTNRPLVFEDSVRDILVGAGAQEVVTYSLTMPEKETPLQSGPQAVEYVRLKNPISSERVVMRRTVLAGLLEVAASNLRHTDHVRLFELGPVYLPKAGVKLPEEPRRLGLVLTGKRQPDFWKEASTADQMMDFFDIKGVIESLAHDLHLVAVHYRPSKVGYLHPGKAATLIVGEQPVGDFGQLHPTVAETYGLGDRVILAGELDIEALQALVPARYTYTPVPRYPPALRDIAVIVDEAVTAERIAAEIRVAGGELLRGVQLFDLYRGDSIPPGTKSLAYALTYQADRTLTDKELDKAHKKVEDRLKHVLRAQIRGKE